jgi:adenosine deaminase CECR1
MGGLCSVYKDASSSDVEMDAPDSERISSKLVKHPKRKRPPVHITNTLDSNGNMDENQYDQVLSLDVSVEKRRGPGKRSDTVLDEAARAPTTADDYRKQRDEIRSREAALAWDFICKDKASRVEKEANEILQAMRRHDDEHTYAKAPSRRGYRGQEHPRFMGDHFLYNVDLIEETLLFQVARKMPKGAHLHIHFNANLLPHVLIDIAKTMDRMFITSNRPLIPVGRNKNDPGYYHNFDQSRIQFSILSPENEEQKKREWLPKNERQKKEVNLFDPSYPMEDEADKRPPMNFQEFREQFGAHYTRCTVEKWLEEKLVFHDEEAHGMLQTAEGAWDRFNARTQMMKGLFNYESAYRKYTRLCLQEFVDDNIQYAEIRPNFMTTNQLWTDDGESRKDNEGIMEIIIEECESFQRDTKQYFAGIKVIYCTPRSFEPELVQKSLDQCLEFKKKWPQWIAGEYTLLFF